VEKSRKHGQVRLGGVTSIPGTKKSGHLRVAEKATSSIDLPLTIIQGEAPGPTLVVLAGEHGCEYCGIFAAVRIIKDAQPQNMSGTLVIIPLANPPAFEERSLFVNPIDGVNLYASYPGSPDGTISHIMAYRIFSEVTPIADYLIHLHGADYNESLIPFNYYARTGNSEVDSMSRKLASCFPVEYVLEAEKAQDAGAGSPKGTSYAATATGTLYGEASALGIPSTMCESGREGKIEEEFVKIHYTGIINAMKLLGMLAGTPTLREHQSRLSSPILVSNRKAGLFSPIAKIGDRVSKGETIGEILNFSGDVIESITSPIEGMIVDRINFAAADAFPTQRQPYLFYIAKTG
jgi:uncharacterized protein